jgi:hypothetical protein
MKMLLSILLMLFSTMNIHAGAVGCYNRITAGACDANVCQRQDAKNIIGSCQYGFPDNTGGVTFIDGDKFAVHCSYAASGNVTESHNKFMIFLMSSPVKVGSIIEMAYGLWDGYDATSLDEINYSLDESNMNFSSLLTISNFEVPTIFAKAQVSAMGDFGASNISLRTAGFSGERVKNIDLNLQYGLNQDYSNGSHIWGAYDSCKFIKYIN